MDRGAWRATVHGVSKSQTWLINLAQHSPPFASFMTMSTFIQPTLNTVSATKQVLSLYIYICKSKEHGQAATYMLSALISSR